MGPDAVIAIEIDVSDRLQVQKLVEETGSAYFLKGGMLRKAGSL